MNLFPDIFHGQMETSIKFDEYMHHWDLSGFPPNVINVDKYKTYVRTVEASNSFKGCG